MAWDIGPDGKRFLMVKDTGSSACEINVIVTWFEELRQRVPRK